MRMIQLPEIIAVYWSAARRWNRMPSQYSLYQKTDFSCEKKERP